MRTRYKVRGMIMWAISAFAAVITFSGCALINGESDYKYYPEALTAHSDAETRRITAQSQAIVSSLLKIGRASCRERV